MAQQIINVGSQPDNGDGDPLRTAFVKTNENFTEIYQAGPVGSNIQIANNTISTSQLNGNIILAPRGIGVVQTNSTVMPRLDNVYDLGTPSLRYNTLFLGTGGFDSVGNITGNYFIGNGSLLTGIVAEAPRALIWGNTNLSIANVNSNITFTVTGVSNVLTVTSTGLVTGNIQTNTITALANITTPSITANLITAGTGNANIGNIVAVTINTSNLTASNTVAALSVTATGNVTGNILKTGNVTVTDNAITASGNITASYFLGNFAGNISGNVTVPGSNTGVVFNDDSLANSTTGFTFNKASNAVAVAGNLSAANLSVTSNISGGNVTTAGIANIGTLIVTGTSTLSGNVLGNLNVTGNATAGNIATVGTLAAGNTTITGNLSVSTDVNVLGNLKVDGNVTYVNVENLNVKDPIIGIGRGANNTPLTTNDGKDRGEQLWYYRGIERSAFIGYDDSAANLLLARDVTITNEIVYVNELGTVRAGDLDIISVTASGNVVVTGNTSSGNIITAGRFGWSGTGANSRITNDGSIQLIPDTAYDALAGIQIGGSGYVLGPNGSRNLTLNYNSENGLAGAYRLAVVGNQSLAIANFGTNATGTIGNASAYFGNAYLSNVHTGIITATGNITGGNLSTTGYVAAANIGVTGIIEATGNIIGGNLITVGTANVGTLAVTGSGTVGSTLSVTGNLSGGNVNTAGQVVATGNINTTAQVVATGNVTGGNLVTTGFVAAGNIGASGIIEATGNIVSNANVAANNIVVTNDVSANTGTFTGNVTAHTFIGNIQGNIDAGGSNTTIQFNDDDTLAGSAAFTFDKSSNLVTALGNISAANLNTGGHVTATSNVNAPRLRSTNTNLAAPSPGNYNSERVTLYDFNNNTKTNYAIGVEASAIWMGVDSNLEAQGFKWYGNTTEVARLSAVGNLVLAGNLVATANVIGGNLVTAGQAAVTGNITGGNLVTAGLISATGNITSGANISGNFVAAGSNRQVMFNDNGLISSSSLFTFDKAGPTISLTNAAGTVITGYVSSLGGSDLNITPATNNLVIWGSANPRFSNTYTLGTSTFQWRNLWAGNANIGAITVSGAANFVGNVAVTANLSAGNISTIGAIAATGNITGGNLVSNAVVVATGNVTGANIVTAGMVSATGNIVSAANINGNNLNVTELVTAANANITSNVSAGNISSAALITATGNITGGNLVTAGVANVTGNIYGNHIIAAANIEVLGNKITTGTTTGLLFEPGNISLISGNIIVNGGYIYSQNGDTAIVLVNNGEIGSVGIENNLQVGKDGQGNLDVAGYANVTSNLTVGGAVTATSNVTGGNLNTAGQVVATGNVTGGNLITSGQVVATGNINTTANVIAANIITANINSSTGILITTSGNNNIELNPGGTGNVVLDNNYINSVANPIQDQDAATKIYVDNLVSTAISYHEAVVAATTANLATTTGGTITYAQPNGAGNGVGATITTTGSFNLIDTANVQTANTRILVKDEANAVLNGVYVWSNATVITRSSDTDTYGVANANTLAINDYFYVSSGNVNKGSAYIVDSPTGVITFGTSNIQFAQFSSTQVYTGGNGINVAGTIITAKVDNDTTAFDGTGNIVVKASANLTTPNIGAATGTSLIVNGNITANNISANSFLAATTINATGNITGGNINSNGLANIAGTVATGNLTVTGFANISGNLSAIGNVRVGQDLSFSAAYANLQYAGSANNYVQLVAQNKDNGSAASTDFVATADNGTDADTYIDMGINSSGYSQAEFGLQKPNDGYLYVAGNTTTGGGNLVLSTLENNDIIFSTGGANTGDEQGRFQYGNGFKVTGNVYATGNIHAPWFIGNIFGNISGNLTVVGPNRGVVFNDDGVANSGAAFTFDKLSNLVSITGNLSLSGNVTANGNVSGNYILGNGAFLSGVITSVANINNGTSNVRIETSGGNIMANVGGTANVLTLASTGAYVDGLINATGNITGANIFTAGIVSATGNITGGNLITSGQILATGNVTGNYFYGNGYFLNGVALDVARIYNGSSNVRIDTSGGNILANVGGVANVFAITTVGANVSGNLDVTGNVSANYYLGNGAFLTGVITSVANINNGTSNVRIDTPGGNIYANVGGSANVVEISSNALTVNGNIESVNGYFVGNGVFLTGVVASSSNSTGVTNINYGLSNVRIDTPGGNISANVGSSANVLVLTTNGANITGNLAVTGNVSASYFIGNGSQLTGLTLGSSSNIANGSSNVNIPTANGNVNTTVGGTANVFVVTAGGANVLGNLAVTDTVTAAEFIGNANASSLLTGTVPSGRLTGTYSIDISGHANTANTVTDASQPNITSVGTLNSLTVTGNITTTTGNISGGNLLTTGIVQATANITGGNLVTAGQVVATGNVIGNYFIGNGAFLTGIDTTLISNGTSNVKIVSANGNATVNIDGTSNVAVFANTGVYVTGLASVSGNVVGGNLSTAGQISATGNITGGNLVSNAAVSAVTVAATGNVSGGNITTVGLVSATGNVSGGNVTTTGNIDATGNLAAGNISTGGSINATANVTATNFFANGAASVTTTITANGNITGANVLSNAAVIATGNVSGANITTTGAVDATGNITGGNFTTTGIANIGTLQVTGTANIVGNTNVTSNIAGGNILTTGLITATGNITGGNLITSGDAVIAGNLTVSGNTTYVNVTELNVEDPIIGLGRNANNTPLTVDDGKDRGTQLWYYSSSEKSAFIGYDNSATKLIAASNVTIANELVTVNDYGNFQVGMLEAANANVTGNINTQGIVASGNISGNYYFGNAVNMTGIATATSVYSTINLTGNVTGNSAGNVTLRAANSLGNLNLQSGNGITMSGNATNGNLIIAIIGSTNDGTFWGAGGDAGLVTDAVTETVDNGLVTDPVTSSYDLGVFEYGGGTGGGTLTAATIAPTSPAIGDQWIDTSDGTLYLYFNDGNSNQWAQMASVYSINQTPDLANVSSDLIPSSNVTYNIGNTTNSWNTIYASALITSANANISGNIAAGNISATGNISASYVLGNGSQLSGISTGITTGKAIAMNIVFGG